jgi:hypothetical protein
MFADWVTLRNPSTGGTRTIAANSTVFTNDVSAATTVNGRDQAAVFTAGTWVYLYFVGTGFGQPTTLSSASPSAPAFLTGQNECALAGAIFNAAGPKLQFTGIRGSWVYYSPPQAVIGPGSTTTETSVSLAGVIPPNALNLAVRAETVNAAGAGTLTSRLRVFSGVDYYVQSVTASDRDGTCLQMPNLNQLVLFVNDGGAAGGSTFTVECLGYQIPNGG